MPWDAFGMLLQAIPMVLALSPGAAEGPCVGHEVLGTPSQLLPVPSDVVPRVAVSEASD